MILLEICKYLSAALGLLLTVCYAYQLLYLFVPFFAKKTLPAAARQYRYAVLIAARNEEQVLPYLLQTLAGQDYPAELYRVFVVADNCTDQTARVARENGATVFERFNTRQVGKGYALDHLLRCIDESEGLDSFDAFLIFDADNLLQPDYITQINKLCDAGYEGFCGYRNSKNFGSNWVSAGHTIWYLHDSVHLNRSRMLLGNPCAVTGTGFGFTRQLLEKCGGWNFFTLTEDIEFSTWCATRGIRIGYCHDAVLFDEQPRRFRQSWRQRTRWTQGGVQVSVRYAGDLFRVILQGGRTGYASFESTTLSLWGYGTGAVCAAVTFLTVLLSAGWMGLGKALLTTVLSTFCVSFFVAALTLLTEWKRIRATTGQKLLGLLAFPMYILTGIPISVTALFRKFHWPPIEHTVAVSGQAMQENR